MNLADERSLLLLVFFLLHMPNGRSPESTMAIVIYSHQPIFAVPAVLFAKSNLLASTLEHSTGVHDSSSYVHE